jgi:hypothetical protein
MRHGRGGKEAVFGSNLGFQGYASDFPEDRRRYQEESLFPTRYCGSKKSLRERRESVL